MEETLNKVVDDKLKAMFPKSNSPGQQRTGRTTFRDMLADIMGGPFQPPKGDGEK